MRCLETVSNLVQIRRFCVLDIAKGYPYVHYQPVTSEQRREDGYSAFVVHLRIIIMNDVGLLHIGVCCILQYHLIEGKT